jgi:hypothetical protein
MVRYKGKSFTLYHCWELLDEAPPIHHLKNTEMLMMRNVDEGYDDKGRTRIPTRSSRMEAGGKEYG